MGGMRSRQTLVGCLAAWGCLAQAQQGEPPRSEEEEAVSTIALLMGAQVVTASRQEESSRRAPARVLVVDAETLRQRGYRSLLDLLSDLPDFKVERNVHEHYFTSFAARGVPGADKFLVLMDGVRITGPTNEPMPIFENYPVHFLRRVEVVYGPTSALYGADAVSAVVNLITREPGDEAEGLVEGGESGHRYGRFYASRRLGEGVALRLGGQVFSQHQPAMDRFYADYQGFSAQRTGRFLDFGGARVRPALPFDPEPSQQLAAAALFLGLDLGPLRLSYFQNQSRFPASNKNTPDHAIYADDVFIGHRLEVVHAAYTRELGPLRTTSTLAFARLELNPNSNYRDVFGYYDRAFKYARSESARAEFQVDWSPRAGLECTGGLTFEAFDTVPWSADLTAPVDPNGALKGQLLGSPGIPADFFPLAYRNQGAFLQARFDAGPRWHWNLGLRFDRNSRSGSSSNPRLGWVWEPSGDFTLKASFGSAFLAPSPYESFLHYGAFTTTDGGKTYTSGFWRLPNPNLQPIRSQTLEVVAQKGLGRRWVLEASAYQTRLRNLFQVVSDAEVTRLYGGHYKGWPVDFIAVQTNLGRQENRGGSLLVTGSWGAGGRKLRASLGYSYVDGQVDRFQNGAEVEIERVSPHMGKVAVEWAGEAWSVAPRLLWIGTQRVAELDPATGRRYRLPGYLRMDLHLRREWPAGGGRVGLAFTASNALDARYRNINYEARPGPAIAFFGVPQEPRRLALGLSWRQ